MKKLSISLLVMLLIASLFTSCSMGSDDASDVRVKVRLTPSGGGRSLTTDIETINLDDDSITWHYSATKVSETQFNYGATKDSLLPKDGIVTLSQGEWKIKLSGVKEEKTVYASEEITVTIKWNFYEPNVTVPIPVNQNTGDNGFIVINNVKIPNGTSNVSPNYILIDGTEIKYFPEPYLRLECAPGSHKITFEYISDNGDIISSKSLFVTVLSGRETTISGNIEENEIISGGSSAPSSEVQAIEVKKEAEVKVETSVAPAQPSSSTEPQNKTTVTFPAGSFNADSANAVLNLSVKSADSNFSVSDTGTPITGSSAPVASIDVSLLVDGQEVTAFNGKEVLIETYITQNLVNVVVYYKGQPLDISDYTYEKSNGKLTIKTTHFSEFYVGTDSVAVIGNVGYDSLEDAINKVRDNETITLLKNSVGNGIKVGSGKNFTVDFNTYTYDINGSLVGSTGTETNGFQLLRDSNIEFKNGTITSNKAKILIQNYCNLTLSDVTLDGSKLVGKYTLSNNYGNITVTGNTSIIAKEGNCAFDLYYWPGNGYGEGVTVTFDEHFTGTVTGIIEYGSDGTASGKSNIADKAKLVIKSGSFDGTFSTDNLSTTGATGISIEGGSFTDFASAIKYASEGAVINLEDNITVTLDNGIANGDGKSRNITFKGNGSQTVDVVKEAVYAENGWLNYQRGSSFTFENLTIQAGEGSFDGIVCNELTFKNCTIKGKLTLYGKATFINCTFENTMENQYSIWTWGGKDVMFEGCTFNTNGKAILLYAEKNTTKLTVNNCTFNDRNNGAANKAAIEIGDANYGNHNNFTVVINRSSVETGFANGQNTTSKLWANKNNMDADHLTVTIDGSKVH